MCGIEKSLIIGGFSIDMHGGTQESSTILYPKHFEICMCSSMCDLVRTNDTKVGP